MLTQQAWFLVMITGVGTFMIITGAMPARHFSGVSHHRRCHDRLITTLPKPWGGATLPLRPIISTAVPVPLDISPGPVAGP